jgi:hypothetical protein
MKVKVISLPYLSCGIYQDAAFCAKVLSKQEDLDIHDEILCYFSGYSHNDLQALKCATLLSLASAREEEIEIEGKTEPGNIFHVKTISVKGYRFIFHD